MYATLTQYNIVHPDAALPPLHVDTFPILQKAYKRLHGKSLQVLHLFGRPVVYVVTPD